MVDVELGWAERPELGRAELGRAGLSWWTGLAGLSDLSWAGLSDLSWAGQSWAGLG